MEIVISILIALGFIVGSVASFKIEAIRKKEKNIATASGRNIAI